MPVQWILWAILVALAVFLTIYFNKDDSLPWKLVKFFGVLISTMPVIGIIQGLIVRTRNKHYAEACFYQAAAGVAAYFLMKHVFHVVG